MNKPYFRASECSVFAGRGRKDVLTDAAKNLVKEYWLRDVKKFNKRITSKEMTKGILGEDTAITMLSKVDGVWYSKNQERKFAQNLTGECDILLDHKIIDIKCPWDALTFMKGSKLETAYEWQGRAYMHLYDKNEFELVSVLIDCPDEVYDAEYSKFCYQHGIIDDHLDEYQEILEQFRLTLKYPRELYSPEERIKRVTFYRDEALEKRLLEGIQAGVEYYHTLTLNSLS